MIDNNLKFCHEAIEKTQKELADECSISQTTYSNYELGINLTTSMTLYTNWIYARKINRQ